MTSRNQLVATMLTLCLVMVAMFTMPTVTMAEDPQAQERLRLLEVLKRAQPAPNPPGPTYTPENAAASEQRFVVGFDLTTGQQTVWSRQDPVFAGVVPPDPPSFQGPPAGSGGADEAIGLLGPAIQGTAPAPIYNSLVFPFNTVFKLLMRFNVSGTDYYYVCSAASAGSFHLVTAGHCLYNWDPNQDGNTSDATWASEIWVWAAQTDQVDPFDVPDRPYGEAKATYLRSYTGWTSFQNYDHDWGVITLDRRVGDHTGWMGRETVETTALNFSGYPIETPYVPEGTLVQYAGFDTNNVASYTCCRINLDAFIYGGHSGGPSWRYESSTGNRWIQGVHSTSDRAGSATDTRLTDGKRSDLNSYMGEDETARPPTARPDLIEYVFDLNAKDLLANTVQQGASFQVKYNALNAGFAHTGDVRIDFYLSTNNIISTTDTLIGTITLSGFAAWSYTLQTTTLTVPLNQPTGSYYVGWIMTGTVPEYTTIDNTVVIASETLTVTSATKPTVTVNATDANAAEAGLDPGVFTVSRTGPTGSALTVFYALGGSATNGTDYQALPGSVTIPAGQASTTITVTPIDDALVEGDETVVIQLQVNAAYTLGTPNSATVTIADNDSPLSNLALNKPATQSSDPGWGGPAGKAVDGNTNGNYAGGSVTHTNFDAQAWWQVDLGGLQSVQSIEIWNRTDCCSSRLSNFNVLLLDSNQAVVGSAYVAGQAGSPTTVPLSGTARYVKVQLVGTNYLSLAEVKVWGTPIALTNLAFNKSATQSSDPGWGGPAGKAVDGNTDGNWADGSVTHTNLDVQAWWQVDLGSLQSVQSIEIWNRTDCCSDRLSNFNVLLLDTNQAVVDGAHVGGQAGSPTTVALSGTARYVKVQLVGTNYLSLAEVKVWGTPPVLTNLAFNKPATQSSDPGFGGPASKAVDGNTDGNYADGSVTHTNLDAQAWWEVDLGSPQAVQSVEVWNRTDCCSDRLSFFNVLLLDSNQVVVGSAHVNGQGGSPTIVPLSGTARYVRVQLVGTNYLSLAEVKVWGTP